MILNLDKLPFEEMLVRVKELARAKKLEKDVAQGRTGVSMGSQRHNGGFKTCSRSNSRCPASRLRRSSPQI